MFQTDSDYDFDTLQADSINSDFRIQPNTTLSINVFTNDGSLLLEYSTGGGQESRFILMNGLSYVIDAEGYVELPVIGKQYLVGKTIRQAQDFLSEKYEERYNNTFVVIRVESRRVMVYNGRNSTGTVVALSHNGISVIEAITLAGGIGNTGDATNIKLIRKKDGVQEVYQIDLSKIDGIKYANTAVESGDIIYVQPTPRIGRELLDGVQPVVTIISSVSLIYLAFTRVF